MMGRYAQPQTKNQIIKSSLFQHQFERVTLCHFILHLSFTYNLIKSSHNNIKPIY